MKKKLIERTAPKTPTKKGQWVTVQQAENILILNIYSDRILQSRYCINTETYEYATLKDGFWHEQKLDGAMDEERYGSYGYIGTKKDIRITDQDRDLLMEVLKAREYERKQKIQWIVERREDEYYRDRQERKEYNRIARVEAVMKKVPELPEHIREWIDQKKTGGLEYMFKNRETGMYGCSRCGEQFESRTMKKNKDGSMILCPHCGESVKVIKRRKSIDILTGFAVVQPIDEEMSVVRHFDAVIYCDGGRKSILLDEAVRIILFKKDPKRICDLYYNQYQRGYHWFIRERECFDNKGNPANRRIRSGYLYDAGMEEAFQGTGYQGWERVFGIAAAGGLELNYNLLMCAWKKEQMIQLTELLCKGRFYRLLKETSEDINVWSGEYFGRLNLWGGSIKEVFGIGDQQKINRIRDRNGGKLMIAWMKWSEKEGKKIPDKALDWLIRNGLTPCSAKWMEHMNPEQFMNYIERQKRESYPGRKIRQIAEQYADYMDMCRRLHKDTEDEMVYRPRELKRRHDEAVEECRMREVELEAEKYTEKFGEAEMVLQSIREKFEYEGEQYRIIVPQKIVEIVKEGRSLHHCAGATDRYFDRIRQQETYICFLRKKEHPEEAYYTIEVEPGGTIRQHRGMYDEEPDIEEVRPFLREWQQVIRKRMKQKDHELAEVSRVKREENIEDLRRKNNTRVLDGLMKDLMEAM